jgi:hypothetical protein
MYEEPDESPAEKHIAPADRARDKAEEFRIHAELAAVFEGPRKFDARLHPLDASLARDLQRAVGKLDKSRKTENALLPPEASSDAAELLNGARSRDLAIGDYHVHRRPGELMIARWIEADQVETFYERLQAHFDAALEGFREEERQTHEWKKDPDTLAYLAALDKIELKMADRYYRDPVRKHRIYCLSTQTADELNIQFLAELVMGLSIGELVGSASLPPDDPAESDLAWFYKLYALRGMTGDSEQMFFFAYLQKSDDNAW